MDDTKPQDIIEIRDPEIDVEAIMRQIREKIRERREEAEAQGIDIDSLAAGDHDRRFDDDLYREMRQVSASASQMGVILSPAEKDGIPILSVLSNRIRLAMHQLVVYYVNMLAAQQNHHNGQLVRLLMKLVRGLERESHPEQVAELQAEVEALRAEVARLAALVEAARE
jgi:hypothetical protein